MGEGSVTINLPSETKDLVIQNVNEIPVEIDDQVSIMAIGNDLSNAIIEFRKGISLNNIYVDYNTGVDIYGRNNNGNQYGTINAPFKTLQYAVNRLPKILNNRSINIYFYRLNPNEVVYIDRFNGGYINIEPYNTGANDINSIFVNNCSGVTIDIRYMDFINHNSWAASVFNSYVVGFWNCNIDWGTTGGFLISTGSKAVINHCDIYARTTAIRAEILSEVYSMNNTGNYNGYGLVADGCSVIGKNGTQPTLSQYSDESSTAGSVIKS